MAPTIAEIAIADDPRAWAELGFRVDGDESRVGTVTLRFADADGGRAITGWTLRDAAAGDLDGLRTETTSEPVPDPAPDHPNGTIAIDHVVVFSPQLDRTVAALEGAGLDLRRIREEPTPAGAPRQAFFRLAEVILEVIQQRPDAPGHDPQAPAWLWGITFSVSDLDGLAARLGEHAKGPRDAVQPGRRILTLRRGAGLRVPVAFMSA